MESKKINMIIGSGLIGAEFKNSIISDNDQIVIYAKGVSNSNCSDANEFIRDFNSLYDFMQSKNENVILYYISTCGVYSEKNNLYIKHKLRCEELVRSYKNIYIVRLPQVAGKVINDNNLCGYIYNCLTYNKKIHIFKNAKRNIIDVEDVKKTLLYIIINEIKMPETFNIAAPEDIDINDFIKSLEIYTGRTLDKIYVEGEACNYKISINDVRGVYSDLKMNFENSYALKTFIKNYLIY